MTESLHWSDRFLLGYTPLDQTHEDFVRCVAALQAASATDLAAAMRSLQAHCVEHFAQEEAWMGATGFPAAQCHADEHAAVLASVREVLAMCDDPAQAERAPGVARELAQALAGWFPGHADYMDAALAHWMSKRSLGGAPVVLRRDVTGGAVPAPMAGA